MSRQRRRRGFGNTTYDGTVAGVDLGGGGICDRGTSVIHISAMFISAFRSKFKSNL